MLSIFIYLIVQIVLVYGIGSVFCHLVLRIHKKSHDYEWNFFRVFWIGFCVILAMLQAWNFFAPINSFLFFLLLCMGVMGCTWSIVGKYNSAINRTRHVYEGKTNVVLMIICTIVVVFRGVAGSAQANILTGSDTILYHLSSVSWANAFPVVPGLANLHSRLGVNSSFLLYAALIDNSWGDKRSAWLVSGFLQIMVCLQWIHVIFQSKYECFSWARIYCILTLPYVVLRLLIPITPCLYYDQQGHILQLVLFLELIVFIRLLKYSMLEYNRMINKYHASWFLILLMTASAFSIKPIGLVTMMAVSTLAFLMFMSLAKKYNKIERAKFLIRRSMINVFILPAILVLGVLGRNAILSGWILWPAPVGCLPVDWAMPKYPVGYDHVDWSSVDPVEQYQSVVGIYLIIKSFARAPGPEFRRAITEGASFWLPPWWRSFRSTLEFLVFLCGLGAIVMSMIIAIKSKLKHVIHIMYLSILCIILLNLVLWFLSAPDMRFGDVFFWIWLGVSASWLNNAIKFKQVWRKVIVIVYCICMLFLLVSRYELVPKDNILLLGTGNAPVLPTKIVMVYNNNKPAWHVNVPIESTLCGDAELPCSPFVRKHLEMRNIGCLGSGFRVNVHQEKED